MIEKLSIKNYKSIKDLDLDCKKINLFIGKPNVGKSNILEAISLFQNGIGEHIRKEDFRNLFFDQDIEHPIKVENNLDQVRIDYDLGNNIFYYLHCNNISLFLEEYPEGVDIIYDYLTIDPDSAKSMSRYRMKKDMRRITESINPLIVDFYELNGNLIANFEKPIIEASQYKPYLFKKGSYNTPQKEDSSLLTLAHPFGENLFTVLKNNRPLLREVSELFKEYGYNLVIDFVTDQAEIQKNVDGVVYKIPFVLIADTLQRMIFHTCAIRSNKDNILLFEEPENHSFPPYIKRLAYEIIEDDSNQFFIATHSPYLFDTIVADAPKEDVAVHVVTFENFQTKTRLLTSEEISTITNHGIDVFFNLNLFSNES